MKIIYTSGAGSTKKYAEALSEKTGLECVSLEKAGETDEEIIYMGWTMMGEIQGLAQARQSYKVAAVVSVNFFDAVRNSDMADVKEKNSITEPYFMLPGNYNVNKLPMMYKMLMNMALKMMKQKYAGSDEASKKALAFFEEGGELYDEEKLAPIIEWING